MANDKNITYLLGAGASRSACPIWKEQGEKMMELAQECLNMPSEKFEALKYNSDNDSEGILWDIGYFGSKAILYGTIDTFARKLFLNEEYDELAKLKLSVSIFFTVWQMTDDSNLKANRKYSYESIDKRYYALMAAILEKPNSKIQIKNNIKFVSWNYDLQLEHTFKAFQSSSVNWYNISNFLKFIIEDIKDDSLNICHLNGYHGFYKVKQDKEEKEIYFLDRINSKNVREIIDSLSNLYKEHDRWQVNLRDHINYAWEKNESARGIRNQAKKIFSETNILVIIGYSFPNFNKEIDKDLFGQLNESCETIYYQDPNADEKIIQQLVKKGLHNIECQRVKLDHFLLPYEF